VPAGAGVSVPLYEWRCETCGESRAEAVRLSELGDRHPSAEAHPCPQGHGAMGFVWPGRSTHISLQFPLHDAADKYQDIFFADLKRRERTTILDRHRERVDRKAGEERVKREGAKVFV